jgi:hypothetical protein
VKELATEALGEKKTGCVPKPGDLKNTHDFRVILLNCFVTLPNQMKLKMLLGLSAAWTAEAASHNVTAFQEAKLTSTVNYCVLQKL